ncbi:hypothetical protein QTN25_010222 [Entamoeba marina]
MIVSMLEDDVKKCSQSIPGRKNHGQFSSYLETTRAKTPELNDEQPTEQPRFSITKCPKDDEINTRTTILPDLKPITEQPKTHVEINNNMEVTPIVTPEIEEHDSPAFSVTKAPPLTEMELDNDSVNCGTLGSNPSSFIEVPIDDSSFKIVADDVGIEDPSVLAFVDEIQNETEALNQAIDPQIRKSESCVHLPRSSQSSFNINQSAESLKNYIPPDEITENIATFNTDIFNDLVTEVENKQRNVQTSTMINNINQTSTTSQNQQPTNEIPQKQMVIENQTITSTNESEQPTTENKEGLVGLLSTTISNLLKEDQQEEKKMVEENEESIEEINTKDYIRNNDSESIEVESISEEMGHLGSDNMHVFDELFDDEVFGDEEVNETDWFDTVDTFHGDDDDEIFGEMNMSIPQHNKVLGIPHFKRPRLPKSNVQRVISSQKEIDNISYFNPIQPTTKKLAKPTISLTNKEEIQKENVLSRVNHSQRSIDNTNYFKDGPVVSKQDVNIRSKKKANRVHSKQKTLK